MNTENEPPLIPVHLDDRMLLEQIQKLLKNSSYDTGIRKFYPRSLEGELLQSFHPRIEIVNSCIVCDNRKLDLTRSPKILELFRVFLEVGELGLSRNVLLHRIYADEMSNARSSRFRQSYGANLIKLLSRARIMTTLALGGVRNMGLDWFTFDPAIDGWRLYRITSPYIRFRTIRAPLIQTECETDPSVSN